MENHSSSGHGSIMLIFASVLMVPSDRYKKPTNTVICILTYALSAATWKISMQDPKSSLRGTRNAMQNISQVNEVPVEFLYHRCQPVRTKCPCNIWAPALALFPKEAIISTIAVAIIPGKAMDYLHAVAPCLKLPPSLTVSVSKTHLQWILEYF